MTMRNAVLVLLVSISAVLLGCPPGSPPPAYDCVCRDGNNVTEVTSTLPCSQTPGCIPGPGGKAPPPTRGADGGDAAGGG